MDIANNNDDNVVINNNEWEVLTPTGWQDFEGIKKTTHNKVCKIYYEDAQKTEQIIECSLGHQIYINHNNEEGFLVAELINPETDFIISSKNELLKIIKKEITEKDVDLYDLVNVKNGFEYFTNNIISHNCAHIEGIDELWLGLRPALSVGGSAILLSTPSGVGSLFHKIWMGAQNGENDFCPIELPWYVHPEHDQKWFEKERAEIIPAMGERGVSQELLCSFASSGDTFLNYKAMDKIYNRVKDPVDMYGPKDSIKKDVWIWKHPKTGHKYIIGADVARGDGTDYSAFHVIDTNKDEVVVEYRGKIQPDKFAELLVEVGIRYNMAIIASEKNNVGFATAIKLKEINYPNLYYEKFHKNAYMVYTSADVKDQTPGFETDGKNRVEILARLEAVLRTGALKTYSKRLYEELQTIIWKNNKAQAQKGYHDDLLMSLAIGNSLYEAGGANTYSDDEMAKALLAGMSTSTNTMGPYSQNHDNNSSPLPPVLTDGNLRDFALRTQDRFQANRGTHNYSDEYWNMFRWMWKD